MARNFGFERLRSQCADFINDMFDQHVEEAGGDSPIEKLLFAALQCRSWLGATEYEYFLNVESEENEKYHLRVQLDPQNFDRAGYPPGLSRLLIRPQAQIGARRVDFLIHALDCRDELDGKWRWRRLIVECDGHDFHERTKEQAKKDRSRDRLSVMEGYDCFRFTGSEIWNDPWGCAEQITDWAVKGWP